MMQPTEQFRQYQRQVEKTPSFECGMDKYMIEFTYEHKYPAVRKRLATREFVVTSPRSKYPYTTARLFRLSPAGRPIDLLRVGTVGCHIAEKKGYQKIRGQAMALRKITNLLKGPEWKRMRRMMWHCWEKARFQPEMLTEPAVINPQPEVPVTIYRATPQQALERIPRDGLMIPDEDGRHSLVYPTGSIFNLHQLQEQAEGEKRLQQLMQGGMD